jgi:hypothetical protein
VANKKRGESEPVRQKALLIAGLLAGLVGVLVFVQSAMGACYFTGGACNFGPLGANTATPLTGTYTSGINYAEEAPDGVGFSKGVRIRRNGNYSDWFYDSSWLNTMHYAVGATQHQCKNAAATAQPMRCGFL